MTSETVDGPRPTPGRSGLRRFTVTWEHPDDQQKSWVLDRIHFPDPLAPLEFAVLQETFVPALGDAFRSYDAPLLRVEARRINTYYYYAMIVEPHVELASRLARGLERLGNGVARRAVRSIGKVMARRVIDKMDGVMARMGEVWSTEWLPEIERHVAFWQGFDLSGAAWAELLAHLEETVARARRIWGIHHLLVLQSRVAMSLFEELYNDLFDSASAFDAYRLLEGFDNKTLEANRALWELSRRALASPEVCELLRTHAAADVAAALEWSPDGRAFLGAVGGYLAAYGERGDRWGLIQPTWAEDPTPLYKNLKDYITQPSRDLAADLERLGLERERLVAEVRSRLSAYPRPVVEQFERLLRAAQTATVLNEDHHFWIESRAMNQVRRLLLEFGRRLAQDGAIDSPDDVFMLTLGELRDAASGAHGPGFHAVVAVRRAEMVEFAEVVPRPMLGTASGPLPDNPLSRAFDKFLGTPPQPTSDRHVLRGHPGAAGRASGPARVIRSLADASKLEPGDVLVAETTAPPWTPLFATAAAVVTDTGGILSHCAVVAREYRIPAVVGTAIGTSVIRDGQILEVDGTSGVVRIGAPAAEGAD